MDEFFEGLKYAAEIVHKMYKGKPVDRAMQKFLSTHLNGKKVSLEIVVKDEHALERVAGFNKFFDEHKHLAKLDKIMESMIGHLGEHPNVIETESIKDILKICLIGYDNRTIEIRRDEVNPEEASSICQNYNISCIASYKHHLFGAKDAELWKIDTPKFDERMVIYAREGAEASALFKEISDYLGIIVAERKKYDKYASQIYAVNSEVGLHARPSAAFIKGYLNGFLGKYPETDIWLRTASKEVNGKGIMGYMQLALEKGHKVAILCKPKEIADEFYKGLEAFCYEGGPLFLRVK